MSKISEKPSPEAKALSLFLMAYKEKDPAYKEQLKRINRQWDLLRKNKISRDAYNGEVQKMLESYGGYAQVVEKTVRFYIDKTSEWKLKGDDQYCRDAQKVADEILKK
ncbi:MAG TPA: hypothetical protein VJ949_08745 [Cryomorphaceae bacterium]|nr:hypothetical protein [Cryomorphaceae bacterium]